VFGSTLKFERRSNILISAWCWYCFIIF
jgi:hypothetical protein